LIQLKYGLDDRPPAGAMMLLGLQWFAIAIPVIVIIGKIAGEIHSGSPAAQVLYLQKMAFVMAAALFLQVFWGHRLPLIIGPSTILLVGIVTSREFGPSTIYTAMIVGGGLLAFLSATGLFGLLRGLFTTRVVACVLLLIAFTLLPTAMNLILKTPDPSAVPSNLFFAIGLIAAAFILHRCLKGVWKSTLIVWVMLAGSALHLAVMPAAPDAMSGAALFSGFWGDWLRGFDFNPGVLISFVICYMALSINDLGSIESVNELLKPGREQQRVTRGIFLTGLANVASGFLGVIGPVNFSLSPGVISSTGCASRYTLLPAAGLLLVLSFSPATILLAGRVPAVVIGGVFLYILCAQVAAGLSVACESSSEYRFTDGLILGLPVLIGTLIAFMPAEVLRSFPGVLRPVIGNGFVVGILAAFFLEHVIFSEEKKNRSDGVRGDPSDPSIGLSGGKTV
jgi:xanthine/uracil permease